MGKEKKERVRKPKGERPNRYETTRTRDRQGKFIPGAKDHKVFGRWLEAFNLRAAGFHYDQIADQLGYYGPGEAYKAVQHALQQTAQSAGVEELRVLEVARLDRMQLALWERVRKGDERAIQISLGISARRSRILGLDAPIKTELGTDPNRPVVVKVLKGVSMDEL